MKDREVCPVMCSHRKKLLIFVVTSLSERLPTNPARCLAVRIEMGEGRKLFSACLLAQPIEKTTCLGTAMRHRSLTEAALTGHPLGVLSKDFAPPNLGRRNRSRYWWPLALSQTQEHVGCHWCGDTANLCNLVGGHGGDDTSAVPVADTPRRLLFPLR
jgi:hypothetical protein